MPGLTVLRPADAIETVAAWRFALGPARGPVALILSRQDLPVLDRARAGADGGLERGAYVLREAAGGAPDLLLLGSGSEVELLVAAASALESAGIRARVVSFPSWELFAAQPPAYRAAVLPVAVRARVAVEAGTRFGWERWVGPEGAIHGIDRFGASAPAPVLAAEFGFTVERVVALARDVLGGKESS